jgi:hypothetical protein
MGVKRREHTKKSASPFFFFLLLIFATCLSPSNTILNFFSLKRRARDFFREAIERTNERKQQRAQKQNETSPPSSPTPSPLLPPRPIGLSLKTEGKNTFKIKSRVLLCWDSEGKAGEHARPTQWGVSCARVP